MAEGPRLNAEENAANPVALRAFNSDVVAHFRANGGKVGGDLGGHDYLLAHTKGANSGGSRTSPLVYVVIDDRLPHPRIVGAVPVFGQYRAKTDRPFPVFELVRTIDHGSGGTDV